MVAQKVKSVIDHLQKQISEYNEVLKHADNQIKQLINFDYINSPPHELHRLANVKLVVGAKLHQSLTILNNLNACLPI